MTRRDWGMLFHMLFILLFTCVTVPLLDVLERQVGDWANTVVGLLALAAFLLYVRRLWRTFNRWEQEDLARLRAHCTGIYRVLGAPARRLDFRIGEEVRIRPGDYGWEAPSVGKDGLVYLEGLTEDWGVLWKAGFRPADVEYVREKPVSQYDWRDFGYPGVRPGYPHQWKDLKPTDPCPYAVAAPERAHLTYPSPY